MINLLAVLKGHLGNLDRIKQVVKLLAYVNSSEEFVKQPFVINGASELLEDVFGEKGKQSSALASNELSYLHPS